MEHEPEWRQTVAEAWRLREQIQRRLILLALERARLEHALARLDETFEGQRIRY